MHASFDAWKEDFSFSQELEALEQELTITEPERHRTQKRSALPEDITDLSAPQPERQSPDVVSAASESSVDTEWEHLVEAVSDRVLRRFEPASHVQEPASKADARLEQALNALQRDNQILAEQIRELLAENDRLQMELECRDVQLSRFRRVIGRLFMFTAD